MAKLNPYESTAPLTSSPHDESDDPLLFAGSMTLDEATQVESLVTGQNRRAIGKLDWCFLTVLLAAMLGWAFREIVLLGETDYIVEITSGVFVTVGLVAALGLCDWYRKRLLRAQQAESIGAFANVAGEHSRTGMRFLVGDYPVSYEWRDFGGYRTSRDALLLYVQFPDTYYFIAASHFQTRDDWKRVKKEVGDQLGKIAKRSKETHPVGKMIYVGNGVSSLVREQWSDAIEAFGKGLELDATDAQALRGRGIARLHCKDYPDAVDDFDRAIEGADEHNEMVRRLRSVALMECEDWERAVDDLAYLSERVKTDGNIFRDHGFALIKLGEFEESVEWSDRAIEVDEADGVAFNNRGAALIELGRLEQAIPDLERAIELVPELSNARRHLRRAQEMLGKPRLKIVK